MDFAKAASGLWNFSAKLKSPFKLRKQNMGIEQPRPYILPTGFGLVFAMVVLFILFLALGSGNNLLYLFVFFLTSVSLSAMVLTNQNLQNIRIQEISAMRAFADERVLFKLRLKNSGKAPNSTSYLLEINLDEQQAELEKLNAQQEKTIEILGEYYPRGRHAIPKCQIQSRFPFAMLRSWKSYQSANSFLVFPSRRSVLPFPQQGLSANAQSEAGLFRDLRLYQSTDSPRRIDWRASLKHHATLVRNFEPLAEDANTFCWEHTQALGYFEARISQLTAWIDQAEKMGGLYALEVGKFASGLGHGIDHFNRCLEHLALLNANLEVSEENKLAAEVPA